MTCRFCSIRQNKTFPSLHYFFTMKDSSFRIACKLIGVSLVAFGIQQCITGQLIAGRPPAWPLSLPGELISSYILGVWLVLNGVAILIDKQIKSLIPTALFILFYCASRNLFLVLWNSDIGAPLTNFGKGITLASGLLFIAVTYSYKFEYRQVYKPLNNFLILFCFYCFGLFLFLSGIQHFVFADFVKFLIPSWIPFPVFWTYAAGVALILTGLALITGLKRQLISRWAAMMIFSWVIVLHIPRALEDNNQNEWTAVFEALAFSALLFMVSKTPSLATAQYAAPQGEFVKNQEM
jgi:uncharacterized membrane protein